MVKKVIDNVQTRFVYTVLDEGIPEEDCSHFLVQFVDMFYPVLDLDEPEGLSGCHSYHPREMFKLVIYGFYRGVTSIEMLSEMAEFHQIYHYVQEILNLLVEQLSHIKHINNFQLNSKKHSN